MDHFTYVRVAAVLGALALPACSGSGSSVALPAAGVASSTTAAAVVPQTARVKPESLRGFFVCPTCTTTTTATAAPIRWKPITSPSPAPSPAATAAASAVVTTESVRGLVGAPPPFKHEH